MDISACSYCFKSDAPLFLVSNLDLTDEICYWYRKRMRIETFSEQKSRGFHLDKCHVAEPDRLTRILLAACLAYLWIIYLGTFARQHGFVTILHRTDRCDLRLFRGPSGRGLDLLDHCLNDAFPIPFDYRLPKVFLFAYLSPVVKSPDRSAVTCESWLVWQCYWLAPQL
jgi:hypothetical protein